MSKTESNVSLNNCWRDAETPNWLIGEFFFSLMLIFACQQCDVGFPVRYAHEGLWFFLSTYLGRCVGNVCCQK